jgi:mono/diheme cytochrome c family protein
VSGAGDGPAAAALRPRPANLAEHDYRTERLGDVLLNGVPGTSMQAWRDFPLADLSALASAVREFHVPREVPLPGALGDLGRRVYADNCVQCHGPDGRGDGFAAGEIEIPPTNFHVQRPTLAESLRALRSGVEGTRMAAWSGRLSEPEILAVAAHVRTFFEPDEPRVEGTGR